MSLNLKTDKRFYEVNYPNDLHIDQCSETACCIRQFTSYNSKFPVVIAFRVTDKLLFFGKEVPDRWIMVRNRTTKLGGLFLI